MKQQMVAFGGNIQAADLALGRYLAKRDDDQRERDLAPLANINSLLQNILKAKELKRVPRIRLLARQLDNLKAEEGPAADLLESLKNMMNVIGGLTGSMKKGNPEFRPDQTRDSHGRWSVEGGSSGSAGTKVPSATAPSKVREALKTTAQAASAISQGKVSDGGVFETLRDATGRLAKAIGSELRSWWDSVSEDTKWDFIEIGVGIALVAGLALYIYLGGPMPSPPEPEMINWLRWLWERMPSSP